MTKQSVERPLRWWQDLAISKKLCAVVGLMALLIATELFTLLFAMSTLSSVRAFVAGEGLWTKAQKDAIHSLYQYALDGNEKHYRDFYRHLEVNSGDHLARIELSVKNFNRDVVRQGFLQGMNHPNDLDGMITLLVRFGHIEYIQQAIAAWAEADAILDQLRSEADSLHRAMQAQGKNSLAAHRALDHVAQINSRLTVLENTFSSALGTGSRWMEGLLMTVLAITVLTVECTGILLTYAFSRNLNRSLKELMDAAAEVGRENFAVKAPVHSRDELGQLACALNRMTSDLKRSRDILRRLNDKLENRIEERTRDVQKRERQLQLIADTVPVLLAQLDVGKRFLFANKALCRWYGRSKEQVIGRSLLEVMGRERYLNVEPYIESTLKGETVSFEHHVAIDHHSAFYSSTLVPEMDDHHRPTGFILVATDVTRYKEIEKLEQAKSDADAASAAKSAFLANMSHEIRTPLGAILGFLDILLEQRSHGLDHREQEKIVALIKRNGQLLLHLIDDILDLSKVEAGKFNIDKVDISFAELFDEVQSLLKLKALEKGLKLKVILEDTIPRMVHTDPFRLRQILLNIVGNAIKFTEQGSVEVRVGLNRNEENVPKLTFVVTDTGKGITREQAKILFLPFSQADSSITRQFGGTGLGLVLSKKLAHLLGGDVVLGASAPGEGSHFIVTIDPGEPARYGRGRPHTPHRSDLPTARPEKLNHLKILLVDDSSDNRSIVTYFLRAAGVRVETASNGKEGVERALHGDFDVILMDLQMPVMDGYAATEELRRHGFNKPIIALTANSMMDEKMRCLECGFNEHVSKPIDRNRLLQMLARLAASGHFMASDETQLAESARHHQSPTAEQ